MYDWNQHRRRKKSGVGFEPQRKIVTAMEHVPLKYMHSG
jgi:hypothetical protein